MIQNTKRLYGVELNSVSTHFYEVEAKDETEARDIAIDVFVNGDVGVAFSYDYSIKEGDVREVEREGQPANEEECDEHANRPV